MASFQFTLILNRAITDDEADTLRVPGSDDMTMTAVSPGTGTDGPVTQLDFDREAESLAAAIKSAMSGVEAITDLRAVTLTAPAQPAEPEQETAAPGENGAAAPVENGAAAPVGNEAAAPGENGPAAPVENGAAAPVETGAAAPVENGAAAPVANGAAAPVDNGAAAPPKKRTTGTKKAQAAKAAGSGKPA